MAYALMIYDTDRNDILPDTVTDSLATLKPIIEKYFTSKAYNYLLVKHGSKTIAQYMLNRKKDKWRKTFG